MSNLVIHGKHDDQTIEQMRNCLRSPGATHGVICADGHLGYAQPVGGVIAYKDHISISGVGFDIDCGNMAVKLNIPFSEIAFHVKQIADDIEKNISFGLGRANAEKVDHELFESDAWKYAGVGYLKSLARDQLGTVGSGNHYVDVFEDEAGMTWIGVHFGSRGLGHKIATQFLQLAGGKDGMMVDPCVIEAKSDLGQQYIKAMRLAGDYAYAGREWVVGRVAAIIDADVIKTVHNHHNYAWLEEHDGEEYWVVRKGATPAFPGQAGFVGGSMGDNAVIIAGVDSPESAKSLYSTVHGAGRLHGRMVAKGKKNKDGTWKRKPMFTRAQMDEWLEPLGVELRGGDVDESPMVYRRLNEVLDEHKGTIEVIHTLKPRIVVMANSKRDFDPYKD